jgi:signal transduction histidine kinase
MTPRAIAAGLLAALAVGLGILAFHFARTEPGVAPGGLDVGPALLGTLAGWAVTLAGLLAWRARRDGVLGLLLALAGAAWLIAACRAPAGSAAIVFTAALVLAHAAPPLIAHCGLVVTGGPSRALASAGYLACIGVAGLGAALLFDPVAGGCTDCAHNLVLIAPEAGAQLAVARWGLALGAGVLAIAALVLVARLVRASAAWRVRNGPLATAAIAFLGLAAAQLAHGVDRGFVSNDALDRRLWTAQAVALLLIAAATAWEPLRRRRTRTQLARLVVELADAPRPGGLRDALAGTLGDPELELRYRSDDGAWMRPDGQPAGPPPDATLLLGGGRVVGALAHRPGLLDDPALRDELAATAQLALEHERLQAAASRQLTELRASRARVVAAGDAERRRLERDLHDGAQQRLVALAISLRLARHTARRTEDVAWAEEQVRTAVAELRELAHGIYPVVLAEEGLAAALELLAEDHARLRLLEVCDERLPEGVESAIYQTVARVLRAAGDHHVEVRVRHEAGCLQVAVHSSGPLPDLQEIEDRIGAIAGTLTTRDGALVARVPIPGFSLSTVQ